MTRDEAVMQVITAMVQNEAVVGAAGAGWLAKRAVLIVAAVECEMATQMWTWEGGKRG